MKDPRIPFVRHMLTWTDTKRLKTQIYEYPDVGTIRNLTYKPGDSPRDFRFDVFIPKDRKELLPVIIDLHGGGLVYGDKLLNQWTAAEMARRGYLVITLNYPLIPHVSIQQQVKVLLEAFQYIESLSGELPMDLTRVSLKGDSGGGLLSILLTGLQSLPNLQSYFKISHQFRIKALILVHTMTHLKRRDLLGYLSKFDEEFKELPNDVQTLFENPRDGLFDLPVWIVTSQNDIMFYKETTNFAKILKNRDQPVKFHEFSYTWRPLNHIFMVTHPQIPESQYLYDSLDRFLEESIERS